MVDSQYAASHGDHCNVRGNALGLWPGQRTVAGDNSCGIDRYGYFVYDVSRFIASR